VLLGTPWEPIGNLKEHVGNKGKMKKFPFPPTSPLNEMTEHTLKSVHLFSFGGGGEMIF